MRVLAWLRGLRNTPTAAHRRPRRPTAHRRPPLRLETLEDRITPSGGLPDPTFGSNGLVTLPQSTANVVMGTAIQADGKIIAVATSDHSSKLLAASQAALIRMNADGSLDSTFGNGGVVNLPVGASNGGYDLAMQPDGKILVASLVFTNNSFFNGASDAEYAIARVNQNGTLDTSFGNNHGWWLSNPTSGSESLSKIAVVPDGSSFSIYAAGNGSGDVAVVKLNANGQLDTTYGNNGISLPVTGATTKFAVSASGEAFVVNGNTLLALNPSGSLDTKALSHGRRAEVDSFGP